MQELKAKFELKDMLPIGITLLVVGIGCAFGLNVIADVKSDDFCTYGASTTGQECLNSTGGTGGAAESMEFNATLKGAEGVAKLPSKIPLIATVIVAAIVIGILVRYLFVQNR